MKQRGQKHQHEVSLHRHRCRFAAPLSRNFSSLLVRSETLSKDLVKLYKNLFFISNSPRKLDVCTNFPVMLCFRENAIGNYLNVNRGNTHAHSLPHDSHTNQHKHILAETHLRSLSARVMVSAVAHKHRTIKGKRRPKEKIQKWGGLWRAEVLLTKRIKSSGGKVYFNTPVKKYTK